MEIDKLLIRVLLGEATIKEKEQIERWLDKNASNQRHFDQIRLVWETSTNLKFMGEIDAHASLNKLKEKIEVPHLQRPKVVTLKLHSLMKVAAAIILLAGGTWFYTYRVSTRPVQFLTQEMVKADTLSDGSIVTLNKYSLLRYPEKFRGKQRQVWLTKGEAFFSITADKTKPFFIHTGLTMIKVVGTSFNVKNKNGDIEVIVETGIVQVSKNSKMIVLHPGEKVLVKQSSNQMVRERNPDLLYNYYRSKEFIADDTPLWRMVAILNEAYGSDIIISRKELYNLPLNTTFKNESMDDILQVISHTFHLKICRKHQQIILY